MQKIPLTQNGFDNLEIELKNLKYTQRPQVIQDIATAREHGDLSENAEYHAAREQQSFIEGRIEQIEAILSLAEVINPATLSGDTVKFSATVMVVDEKTDEETTYQIVGDEESDIENGKLAINSPLSRALIGKSVGDSVEVKTPKGTKDYEILEVLYK